jgi:CPA2 family monovalent cation:H+ antiporter-2
MHGSAFVADLALVLGVAALTAVLARALRQPTVLGYLFAGLLVGPYLPIPIFANAERVGALAEFGVVLVMFAIGLEFRIAKLLRVLPVSGFTAIVQVGFLAWCGQSLGRALGWSTVEATFLGACIAISSTMIVAKVFEQVEVARDVKSHVLGVLVVQDVVAIVLIAAMTAVAAGGGLGPRELALTLGRLGGVLLLLTVGGLLVVPRLLRIALRQQSREILAVVAVGLSFLLALLAQKLGYSVALGAFLAGILVAEARAARQVELVLQPLRDVFAAVFFVSIGMSVDPRAALANLPLILLVSAVVVAAQASSVTLAGGLSGLGLRRGLSAGLALGQIGEFAFIIAAIGINAGVARPELQAILVGVAVLTAFTTPLLLGRSDAIVRAVDRRLPLRVQHLLAANESWFARLRSRARSGAGTLAPQRRALRALVVDAVVLQLVLAIGTAWLPELATWTQQHFGISPLAARSAAIALALFFVIPVLTGVARNALLLARFAGAAAGGVATNGEAAESGGELAATPRATLAAHTARLSVLLGVLLAVGLPALAILRPSLPGAYGMPALATVVLGLGWLVLRSAGRLAADVRSGAGELAELLSRQASQAGAGHDGEEAHARLEADALLAGLQSAQSPPLKSGMVAVGRTLRDLDLRARTGATALAIVRGTERLLLPGGQIPLAVDDVVTLVGSRDALARAIDLLGEATLLERVSEEPA